jgi:hypothetical protein
MMSYMDVLKKENQESVVRTGKRKAYNLRYSSNKEMKEARRKQKNNELILDS